MSEPETTIEDIKQMLSRGASPESIKQATEATEDQIQEALNQRAPEDSGDSVDAVEADKGLQMDNTYHPQTETQEKQTKWAFRLPKIGEVEVDEQEKSIYTKSLLFDEPVVFTIPIPGVGLNVVLQSRDGKTYDAVFEALKRMVKAGDITDVATHNTKMQQLSLATMLVSSGGKTFPRFIFDFDASMEENVTRLIEIMDRHVLTMQGPRFSMMIYAGALFEAKMTLCDNALNDRSFFKPAD